MIIHIDLAHSQRDTWRTRHFLHLIHVSYLTGAHTYKNTKEHTQSSKIESLHTSMKFSLNTKRHFHINKRNEGDTWHAPHDLYILCCSQPTRSGGCNSLLAKLVSDLLGRLHEGACGSLQKSSTRRYARWYNGTSLYCGHASLIIIIITQKYRNMSQSHLDHHEI
jgi:hypothetical protein